jgi:hypothetical protein
MNILTTLLFFVICPFVAFSQYWVNISPPSSSLPDARLSIQGELNSATGKNYFNRGSLYFQDTIHVRLKAEGYSDSHKFFFNISNCGSPRGLMDTVTAKDINEKGWFILSIPFFNLNCTGSQSSEGRTTKISIDYWEVGGSLSVIGTRPMGFDSEYYNDQSNVIRVEYFNSNGQKISPDYYSGLMITRKTYANGTSKSTKEIRM